ncbi:hypothetical protein V498_03860 [Pseudogymnoascus sp. VKM F-4517 (FW-2822)]|nr:hypothetical protein V498_03860 [Pseudogymnoascus sp. VKM F-4517 (FW-2822)]
MLRKNKENKAKKLKESQEWTANYKARIALNKVKKELHIRRVEARRADQTAQESDLQEEATSQLISTMGWSQSQADDDDTGFIRFDGLDMENSGGLFVDRGTDMDEILDLGLF